MDITLIIWILSFVFMIFFAGMEMAFLSSNRLNIELKRKQGSAVGKLLGKFVDAPALFLGTTIIGSLIALTAFVLLTNEVSHRIWPLLNIQSRSVQIVLEITVNVLLTLIFVELIPRAIFRAHSTALLKRLAMPMNFFFWLFQPITEALFSLSNWILKYVFNVRVDSSKSPFNRSDLTFLFRDNVKDLVKMETSTQLLENAQELPHIKIRQCLVPRKEIIGIEKNTPIQGLVDKLTATKRSRIIIYENNIDNILGYVHELDLFKKPATIEEIIIDIPAVPESMSAVSMINKFSTSGKSIAWVVDEFGGTAGIITLEDLLEEIFGDILDEYDTEVFVEKRISEDEYIFSGRLELDYLEEKYQLQFEGNDSETLSGYIIDDHETIPEQKERIIIGDYEFDILSVSDTRIEMIKLKKLK